jgi:tetratricopeptide (TPR) repeat protein
MERFLGIFLWFAIALAAGCHMTAPMHTIDASTVPVHTHTRVAVGPVGIASRANPTSAAEPTKLLAAAEQLQQSMRASQPIPTQDWLAIHPADLDAVSDIQLVSYDNQPNDSATLGAARRAGANYILQGNVVDADLDPPKPRVKRFQLSSLIFPKKPHSNSVTVHWSVIDVQTGARIHEETTRTTTQTANQIAKQFDKQPGTESVLAAASHEGWQFVANQLRRREAVLDLPWLWPGSAQVRKGNGYARQGRWDLAESEWQSAVDRHPTNTAAWHNLSLAAVAREDFELARSRLSHADSWLPGDPTFETLVWIESQQRNYHAAYQLPDPIAGWTFHESAQKIVDGGSR